MENSETSVSCVCYPQGTLSWSLEVNLYKLDISYGGQLKNEVSRVMCSGWANVGKCSGLVKVVSYLKMPMELFTSPTFNDYPFPY
jgi:hypothetical protein